MRAHTLVRRRSAAVAATLTAACVAGSALALGITSPAQAVTTDESFWIPADESLTVHGRGYGHGHGMSQYGAQGAALQGKTYREIVDFYYPGTSWSKVRGLVRVLVTADTTSDVVVSPTRGLRLKDLGDRAVYTLPSIDGLTRWRLTPVSGETVVEYYDGRWRRYRPGGRAALVGDGEFFAGSPVTLWTPAGQTRYFGRLRAASPSPGSSSRDTVNIVSMDRYVKGVVADEMPASWHPEAVKSQSIAARTYATWSRAQNPRRYYQICDTTACQVYGGADAEDPRSNAAVGATAREILAYDGKPAFTQFSASSGGWTSRGSVPYLPAQRDPYDGWSGNHVHTWSTTVDAGRFERSYPRLGELQRIRVTERDGNGEWRGRVLSLVLDGTQSDVTISGDDFRWAFGLRSNWFTIEDTPIIARWKRIGGEQQSRLGSPTRAERATGDGVAQDFQRGQIYYSAPTGGHELWGRVLNRYRAEGGGRSELGFPTSTERKVRGGVWVSFRNGSIMHNRATGPVALHGRMSRHYHWRGGTDSDLGWPTRGHQRIPRGYRADFQNGYMLWFTDNNRVRVRLTR